MMALKQRLRLMWWQSDFCYARSWRDRVQIVRQRVRYVVSGQRRADTRFRKAYEAQMEPVVIVGYTDASGVFHAAD